MRDTEKRGMGDKNVGFFSLFLSFCQQIPEWFPDFDYFSFCDCNNMWGGGNEEYLALSCIVGLAAVVLADVVFS